MKISFIIRTLIVSSSLLLMNCDNNEDFLALRFCAYKMVIPGFCSDPSIPGSWHRCLSDIRASKYCEDDFYAKNCYYCIPYEYPIGSIQTFLTIPDDSSSSSDRIISTNMNDVATNDPIYWSGLNYIEDITSNAKFGNSTAQTEFVGSCQNQLFLKNSSGNNYYQLYFYDSPTACFSGSVIHNPQEGYRYIYPLGKSPSNLSKGTLSLWLKLDTKATSYNYSVSECTLFSIDSSKTQLVFSSQNGNAVTLKLIINNTIIDSKQIAYSAQFFHLYIVWDDNLTEKKFRVFIDNTERIQYNGALNDFNNMNFIIKFGGKALCQGEWAYCNIDNIKIWNTNISSNPSFEYNDGMGVEY